MMHEEHIRIVENSNRAILFVHGILGTPNHFSELIPLIPQNISVYNMLLEGHGKGVKDFSASSMAKWERQVEIVLSSLAKSHNEIYIVAHSLGCLLSIEQAISNEKIKKMFLLAVPLKLFLKPKMFINSLRVYSGKINPENKELLAAKRCCGIAHEKNLFNYLGWVPRFLELFSKIRKTRPLISSIKIPCVAVQSAKDEMVAAKSAKLLQKNPLISVCELQNSGHYYYKENDSVLLKEKFKEFINN